MEGQAVTGGATFRRVLAAACGLAFLLLGVLVAPSAYASVTGGAITIDSLTLTASGLQLSGMASNGSGPAGTFVVVQFSCGAVHGSAGLAAHEDVPYGGYSYLMGIGPCGGLTVDGYRVSIGPHTGDNGSYEDIGLNTTMVVVGSFAAPPPVAPVSTCPGSLLSAEASLAAGVLSAQFRWKSPVPGAGWDGFVVAAATAVPGTAADLGVPAVEVVGSPGFYGATVSGVAVTGSYLRVQSRSAPGCYGVVALGGSPLVPPAVDGGSETDGGSCGFNPFCYTKAALRWAFVPTPGSIQGWSTHVESISTQPPVSFVVAGSAVVRYALLDPTCNGTQVEGSLCIAGLDGGASSFAPISCGAAACSAGEAFDPMTYAGDRMQDDQSPAHFLWYLEITAVWLGVAWYVWTRLAMSFGGKS